MLGEPGHDVGIGSPAERLGQHVGVRDYHGRSILRATSRVGNSKSSPRSSAAFTNHLSTKLMSLRAARSRMSRTSASIERPLRAARTLNAERASSDKFLIVRVATATTSFSAVNASSLADALS